jgi:hypothetical protein
MLVSICDRSSEHSMAGTTSPPDPPQHQPGKTVPANIAQVLHILRVLLGYGRHLAASIEQRSTTRGFSFIARCFGTAKVAVILAHLCRGIMRAVVLERLLLARAARGRDLVVAPLRVRAQRKAQPVPQDEDGTAPPAPVQLEAPIAAPLLTPDADPDEPLDLAHLPTLQQLEAEIRRRPIGRVIADICHDLGVSPGLCTGTFWHQLFDALMSYRGNMGSYYGEMQRRAKRFEKELDKLPALDWPEDGRDAIRRALGFFVGEVKADFSPGEAPAGMTAAAALRPP